MSYEIDAATATATDIYDGINANESVGNISLDVIVQMVLPRTKLP